jgi:hypothetical protein
MERVEEMENGIKWDKNNTNWINKKGSDSFVWLIG